MAWWIVASVPQSSASAQNSFLSFAPQYFLHKRQIPHLWLFVVLNHIQLSMHLDQLLNRSFTSSQKKRLVILVKSSLILVFVLLRQELIA